MYSYQILLSENAWWTFYATSKRTFPPNAGGHHYIQYIDNRDELTHYLQCHDGSLFVTSKENASSFDIKRNGEYNTIHWTEHPARSVQVSRRLFGSVKVGVGVATDFRLVNVHGKKVNTEKVNWENESCFLKVGRWRTSILRYSYLGSATRNRKVVLVNRRNSSFQLKKVKRGQYIPANFRYKGQEKAVSILESFLFP